MSNTLFNVPLQERLIGDFLAKQSQRIGEKTFLEFENSNWTFSEVNSKSLAVAKGLLKFHTKPQTGVLVMLPNCPEMVFTWFGCALIRAINIPINPHLMGNILARPFIDAQAETIVIHANFIKVLKTLPEDVILTIKNIVIVGGDRKQKFDFSAQMIHFDDWLEDAKLEPAFTLEGNCQDIQTIFYTSGTTGPAKGVQTTNAHQFSAAIGLIRVVSLKQEDVLFTPFPLFHGFAARLGVLPCLLVGATVSVVSKFSAENYWKQVVQAKATVGHSLFSTPRALLEQAPNEYEKKHLLRVMFNSHYSKEFEDRFKVPLVEGFSMTETGFVLYSNWEQRKIGSCGKVHEDWEAKLVNEYDQDMPIGDVGELVVRPKLPFIMMQGYLNQPDSTVKAFKNLWFHTGDMMKRDDEGYYYFVDRAKERIRRKGENISSFDIEQTISAHIAVNECVVLPLPNGKEDDIRLIIVRSDQRLSEQELADWIKQKLPKLMWPSYIEFVEALPYTPTFKVEKLKLMREGLSQNAWKMT
jgi:crotonobetaine/carnitine-CoA ligase